MLVFFGLSLINPEKKKGENRNGKKIKKSVIVHNLNIEKCVHYKTGNIDNKIATPGNDQRNAREMRTGR